MPSMQNKEVIDQSDVQEKGMTSEEGQLESEPLNNMKEHCIVDDRENNNDLSAAQPTAIRYRKSYFILSVPHTRDTIICSFEHYLLFWTLFTPGHFKCLSNNVCLH